jgi:hypothetical protein
MLLTSRNEGLGLHADPTCFAFRPRILTPEQSWKLFERIVSSRRDKTGTLSYINQDQESCIFSNESLIPRSLISLSLLDIYNLFRALIVNILLCPG